jgi:hypothetical protein
MLVLGMMGRAANTNRLLALALSINAVLMICSSSFLYLSSDPLATYWFIFAVATGIPHTLDPRPSRHLLVHFSCQKTHAETLNRKP